MEYKVYILYSLSQKKFYIGFTGDELIERIRKHNSNHKGFTGINNDWELKYVESFALKEEAMKREKEIKKWKSKTRIEKLIEG